MTRKITLFYGSKCHAYTLFGKSFTGEGIFVVALHTYLLWWLESAKKVSHSLSQFSSICFHSIEVSDHVWSAILGYFICRLSIRPLLVSIFLNRLDHASTLIITSLYSKNGSLFLVLFFLSLSTLRIRFVTYSPIHVKNDANDVTWDTSGVIIITQNINNVEM